MKSEPATSRRALPALRTSVKPAVLAVTRDDTLIDLVTKVSGQRSVESRFDAPAAREFLLERNVRLVIVDDAAIAESERSWFLDQVRRWAPDAFVIYLASQHGPEVEKRARAHGALFYTAKPIDSERLTQVLQQISKSPT